MVWTHLVGFGETAGGLLVDATDVRVQMSVWAIELVIVAGQGQIWSVQLDSTHVVFHHS